MGCVGFSGKFVDHFLELLECVYATGVGHLGLDQPPQAPNQIEVIQDLNFLNYSSNWVANPEVTKLLQICPK
jgi:hypothetical protein